MHVEELDGYNWIKKKWNQGSGGPSDTSPPTLLPFLGEWRNKGEAAFIDWSKRREQEEEEGRDKEMGESIFFNLEKVKTTGENYYIIVGKPEPWQLHFYPLHLKESEDKLKG